MPSLPLACTVRDCGLLLERRDRAWLCARGHAYDIARRGYINLLQPHDRRSRTAGDTRAALEARQRLLAAGAGRDVLEAVAARAQAVVTAPRPLAVDLGCGTGELLGLLAQTLNIDGIGIDLSVDAAEMAARQFPAMTWLVANADRRLPLLDRTVDLVLSVHGRRHPEECARVLAPDGHLIVAVPAADDLVELREQVQGARVERGRLEALVAEHAPQFVERERLTVRARLRLSHEALVDLLRGTYRGERTSAAHRVRALGALEVTLASDIVIFAPTGRAR